MISALYLDRIEPRTRRARSRRRCVYSIIVSLAVTFIFEQEIIIRSAIAISLFSCTIFIWKSLLEAMYLSLFRTTDQGNGYFAAFAEQYGLALLPFASEVCRRLGIDYELLKQHNECTREIKSSQFEEYVQTVFTNNQPFRSLLEKHGITKGDWIGVWAWYEFKERQTIMSHYVLDSQHIRMLPTLGEAFAYGQTHALKTRARRLIGNSLPQSLDHFYAKYFTLFDQALDKRSGAHVLLIADTPEEALRYIQGYIPRRMNKKWYYLDTEHFIQLSSASQFERDIQTVLVEAATVGNAIIVVPHIASIITAAYTLGIDFDVLVEPFLTSTELHMICISQRDEYHSTVESHSVITRHMENIQLDTIDAALLQERIQKVAPDVEHHYDVFFTFQALRIIAGAIERFETDDMYNKIDTYVVGCAQYARAQGNKHITIDTTLAERYIATIWGTEGTLADTDTSRSASIDITKLLSQRVKGQDEALEQVIMTLDRLRSGLIKEHRPLATFLFLGPTGVGKTETAKALAQAYFGTEDKMLRFDMTEYSDERAVQHLIGSFESGEAGILTAQVRDTRHGVILFDEIEKAHPRVHDLMLQVLDEGYVTDARGGKVNVRNFIIIATSNVIHLNLPKSQLIDRIVEQGSFKAEFLNRFDDIVAYKELGDRQLAMIVADKLEQYAKELYDKKAIRLNITQRLIEYIVDNIEHKSFGGRELQRTIQDKVETVIARAIMRQDVHMGGTVTFQYNSQNKTVEAVYT